MKNILIPTMLILITIYSNGQNVIPLYNGETPPGSEILTSKETARKDKDGKIITIRNVSMPTLTVVQPEQGKANGTAIIIYPGGGFSGLAYQHEGTETANWCASNGITAFILKYRLMPVNKVPYKGKDNQPDINFDSLVAPYVRLAVADGLEAVKYVRTHASEYGIDKTKIGIMGYSAGGTITGSVAQTYDKKSRPNFVAPIYAYYNAMLGDKVPDDAPPMFLVWATDDGIAKGNIELYEKWRLAGRSIEMHSFYSGGHGFSVVEQDKASDKWKELFMDWMINQGFIN